MSDLSNDSAGTVLARVKAERGWGWPDFDRNTSISSHTARAIIEGKRHPSTGMLERLAAELGLHPATFPEYRLAKAREALDERVVGLERALRNLEAACLSVHLEQGTR